MQFMTLNSLLMFDIVFIFFLFLVGVTCLVYYLPPPSLSAIRGTAKGFNGGNGKAGCVKASCGTTTTCTGETVRFRRYSVGSLLSAADVSVGNHRFHSPVSSGEDLLVDCALEEVLSLKGSPVLVSTPLVPPFCACCAEHQHLLRQLEQEQLHHHHHQQQRSASQFSLLENPCDLASALQTQIVPGVTADTPGVDYVQIEIERTGVDPVPPCCYVRAKDTDIKECHGPIHDV